MFLAVALIAGFFAYRGIHTLTGDVEENTTITIASGMSVREIGDMLEEQDVVYSGNMLVRYLAWKNLDTNIQHGKITFEPPHTIVRVAKSLTTRQSAAEREITILPGWDLRDVASYFESEGITSVEAFYEIAGKPLGEQPASYKLTGIFNDEDNLEGYLRPDTFRIFTSASIGEIVDKLVQARAAQFSDEMLADMKRAGRSMHEIITMASIIEREVRSPEDRRLVSDLFWRRYDVGMGLQADSTVHYIVGGNDSVFTSAVDRATDSEWNTYKYAGLPPGPISNPSLDSIIAAIYPEPNGYWYFLTTLDTGEVKYGRTLDEHNYNVAKYLR